MKDDLDVFIPKKIIVGKFRRNVDPSKALNPDSPGGIVSCFFKNSKYLHVSIFERLTGYKPNVQRDPVVQLKKAITDAVNEFDNSPVSGFKINSWDENIYRYNFTRYQICGDVTIEDPRGFSFGMHADLFLKTLAIGGFNVSDGVIAGKFAYGWVCLKNGDVEMALVNAESERYGAYRKWSDGFYVKKSQAFVSEKQLKYGRVYSTARSPAEKYVYLGRIDTYSGNCHVAAFESGKYDFLEFREKESGAGRRANDYWSFPTSSGKHVFYRLSQDVNAQKAAPYAVRSSAGRMFNSEVSYPEEDELPHMYNDGMKKATLANIESDMSVSPCFNMIALRGECEYEEMSQELFEHIFSEEYVACRRQTVSAISTFPFAASRNKRIIKTARGWFKMSTYNVYRWSCGCSWLVQDIFGSKPGVFPYVRAGSCVRYDNATCAEIYAKYKPLVPILYYENGKRVDERFAAFLKPHEIVEKASRI